MDAAFTIATLIGVVTGLIGIITFFFQRQSKVVKDASQRTAQELKTVILADEEESKLILLGIKDYLQTMRSFQESLEKPLQQERQEIRTFSKELSVTAKKYDDISYKLDKYLSDWRNILYEYQAQSKRLETQSDRMLAIHQQAASTLNATAQQIKQEDQALRNYVQQLTADISRMSIVDDQARFSDSPSHDIALVDAVSDIRVKFQDLTTYLDFLNQAINQLSEDSKTHGVALDTTIRTLRNEIKDLVDSLSRNFGVSDHKTLELSEFSKPYEISLVDKLLIYQQVSNEYIHNITTPLASIESAIGNIQDRLPLILQTSDALPTEAASILISSLENASFSIDSIKSILRQGAGFLADNAKRFSVEYGGPQSQDH